MLSEFLDNLFRESIALVPTIQPMDTAERNRVDEVLRLEHAKAIADAPSPEPNQTPILKVEVARWAAQVLHWATWTMLNREELVTELPKSLVSSQPRGETPSEHWSADLCLRFMPDVLEHCRRLSHQDELCVVIEEVLANWPLSATGAQLKIQSCSPQKKSVVLGDAGLRLIVRDRVVESEDTKLWIGDAVIGALLEEAAGLYRDLLPASVRSAFFLEPGSDVPRNIKERLARL